MSSKPIRHDIDVRAQLALSADTLAETSGSTQDPERSRILAAGEGQAPPLEGDDVAVLDEEFEPNDGPGGEGAQLVEVAPIVSRVAVAAPTTATELAQAFLLEALKLVTTGIDPMDLKSGIDAAVAVVVEELSLQSKPIDLAVEIARVATISANGDEEVGHLIADALRQVGRDGVVTIEEAETTDTTLALAPGMQFGRGYLSPYFVTDLVRMEAALRDPLILISETGLSSMQDLVPLLEAASSARRSLLIIADEVVGGALAALVADNLRRKLRVCAVKTPRFGNSGAEVLHDLAILCGTRVFSEGVTGRLKTLTIGELGGARAALIDRTSTTLVGPFGVPESIQGRITQLRRELAQCSAENERKELQKRIADIAGRVAVIQVGARTDADQQTRAARLADALHTTRAAMQEGIVPGGGAALVRALRALRTLKLHGEQNEGAMVVRRAIARATRRSAQTGRAESEVTTAAVQHESWASSHDIATVPGADLFRMGTVEPTRVVRVALQEAAAVTGVMLATEAFIGNRTDRFDEPCDHPPTVADGRAVPSTSTRTS